MCICLRDECKRWSKENLLYVGMICLFYIGNRLNLTISLICWESCFFNTSRFSKSKWQQCLVNHSNWSTVGLTDCQWKFLSYFCTGSNVTKVWEFFSQLPLVRICSFSCYMITLNYICSLCQIEHISFYHLEYSDYCLYLHCYTHNVLVDMFCDLLQVCCVKLGSLHRTLIWTLYLIYGSRLFSYD